MLADRSISTEGGRERENSVRSTDICRRVLLKTHNKLIYQFCESDVLSVSCAQMVEQNVLNYCVLISTILPYRAMDIDLSTKAN